MEKIDYSKLGFKAGLEIHQQLDTHKLFCNCPSVLKQEEPDFIIKRKLHAVAGEAGEIDIAAAYQASLDKEFIYQGYDSICLVELDEEPPHEINKDALTIVLQISILLNAKIIPLSQIMRKTVIDGSNTSGFQRTVLIAREGYVETEQGRVGIEGIFLEEDAARSIAKNSSQNFGATKSKETKQNFVGEKNKNQVVFRLDRLGIPLVEIATAPDIKTPEQAKEVALHIGNILRSCKVKRGLGTIRQDVNLSIKKGARTEIKGVQEPGLIVKILNNEIKRQLELINSKKQVELSVRKALEDGNTEFLRPMPGAARMYPETDLPLLKITRDFINDVKKTLPKLRTEIEKELIRGGLNKEMVKLLFKQGKLDEFKELLEIINNPQLIAKLLLIFPKEIASHEKISISRVNRVLSKDVLMHVLEALKNKKISENQIKHVLERIVKGKGLEESIVFEKEDIDIVEEKIMKIIKDKPGLSEKAYMGLIMKEFKGKISGRDAIEIIKNHIK